jgi:uncharacterized protein YbaR (Trm112 family)
MAVAQHLLEILRCPESRGELIYFSAENAGDDKEEFLFCPKSKLRFRIDEGIPVMLVGDAERLNDEVCEALNARASELGLS